MGLRTASVRRPHVEVMAPALTETSQGQKFELPPNGKLEPDFLINCDKGNIKINCSVKLSGFAIDEEFATASKKSEKCKQNNKSSNLAASDSVSGGDIMDVSPTSMDDQRNEMGIEKVGLDVSSIHKEKVGSDVDQLLHTLSSDLQDSEQASDLRPSVEDIMLVIKSIESNEKTNNTPNDLVNEEIFPMTGTDLTNNLTSFEKELLENVDEVMNISIGDQHDEIDKQKESQVDIVLNELQKRHVKMERRLDFLRRRAYKLQSRMIGKHVSREIAGLFENINRLQENNEYANKRDTLLSTCLPTNNIEPLKPMSMAATKSLVKKIEMAATKQNSTSKYLDTSSTDVSFRDSVGGGCAGGLPSWPTDSKNNLQKVTDQLKTQLSVVQSELDSEATESSSGGESCDEMCTYNNPHQQYLAIHKRALWKYSANRAAIASRWTWLQAQVSDLEYRIRQHTDLHKQVRLSKGAVQLGGLSPPHSSVPPSIPSPVNGYRGQLPGNSAVTKTNLTDNVEVTQDYQCCRTRPLIGFKKRKLLQVSGLHVISKKAARPSTIRCGCTSASDPCLLCTGRTDPTRPRDPPDTLSKPEKVAMVDPSFHPVFSLPEDISLNVHLEALMKTPEWQQRSIRMKTVKGLSKDSKFLEHKSKKLDHRKKYGRLLKASTMSALSAKLKNKIRGRKPRRLSYSLHKKRHLDKDINDQTMSPDLGDDDVETNGNVSGSRDSPSSSPLLHMQSISGYRRNRTHSYDIDNIVIPYSVAASTRVEKLEYKEILTPKWRIADPNYESMFTNNKNETSQDFSQDSDVEDLTENAVITRHDKCEYDEKKKFLTYLKPGYARSRHHKRTDSRAESSGANTPDPMSPPNLDAQDNSTNSPMTSPPATPLSAQLDDNNGAVLPSVAALRKRTISHCKNTKERDGKDETTGCGVVDIPEVAPYERRNFPIDEDTLQNMLENMPENHQFQTNTRSQDPVDSFGYNNYLDKRSYSPDSETTESAIGDGEEDPNDPEWIDMERGNKEKYKR